MSYAELLKRVVREMGDLAAEKRRNINSKRKNGDSIVTGADVECERLGRQMFDQHAPYDVIGEELGQDTSADTYWIIDPIDGTRNYASGVGMYCSMAALVRNDHPSLSAIYIPSTEEFFFSDGNTVHTDSVSPDRLGEETCALSGHLSAAETQNLTGHTELLHLRKLGSSGVTSSYLSKGAFDVGVFGSVHPWDVAPAVPFFEAQDYSLFNDGYKWEEIKNGQFVVASSTEKAEKYYNLVFGPEEISN